MEQVPKLSIIFMMVSGLFSFLLPLGLFVYLRKVKKADALPFLAGCSVMFLFAMTLESLAHNLVLVVSPAGSVIQNNRWLFALYGGLMAGLFEETGRFLAFKTVLKKYLGKNENALMYGAGHGGLEAIMILGMASINNLTIALMINAGETASLTESMSGEVLEQAQSAIQSIITTPSWNFLLGGVERIFAIVLQIALSVIVWAAVKQAGKGFLYPAAIGIHFLADFIATILAQYGLPILAVEAVVGLMAAGTAFFAKRVWTGLNAKEESAVKNALEITP